MSNSHNESVFGYAPNSRFARVLAGDLVQEGAIPILKGRGGCSFHFRKGGSHSPERWLKVLGVIQYGPMSHRRIDMSTYAMLESAVYLLRIPLSGKMSLSAVIRSFRISQELASNHSSVSRPSSITICFTFDPCLLLAFIFLEAPNRSKKVVN